MGRRVNFMLSIFCYSKKIKFAAVNLSQPKISRLPHRMWHIWHFLIGGTLAWKIPWTQEPGWPQSVELEYGTARQRGVGLQVAPVVKSPPAPFTAARARKQPGCPSADKRVKKLWYITATDYYSAIKKNTFESILVRWIKLESITQSEVSQKEKQQYSILTHIHGIYKDGNDDPILRQQKRHRCKEETFGLCGRRRGGMIWEHSIETCILPYVKQMTSLSSIHETGHSKLVHLDNPEGWGEEGGGSRVQDGGHMYTHGWFMSMHGKSRHNTVE